MKATLSATWHATAFEPDIQHPARLAARSHCPDVKMELLRIKTRFLWPILKKTVVAELGRQLRLAANEAMALAADEPFPLLVIQCLLEEKVRAVQLWFQRQQQIRAASKSMFADWLACWQREADLIHPRAGSPEPSAPEKTRRKPAGIPSNRAYEKNLAPALGLFNHGDPRRTCTGVDHRTSPYHRLRA